MAKKSPLDEWQQFAKGIAPSSLTNGVNTFLMSNAGTPATYANAATISR